MSHLNSINLPKPPEPKIVGPDYVQSFDNMSAEDFMKIYLETLKFQDPFRQQDISKSVEDVVRLNQIKFFTDTKSFMETFTAWMNQLSFMQSVNLIGKSLVFATDTVDTSSGNDYYLLSEEEIKGIRVRFIQEGEIVKEVSLDLQKGLNRLDLTGLPAGRFTVQIEKDGADLSGIRLGFKDTVRSIGILGGKLTLELGSGIQVSSDQIIYVGV